HIIGPQTAHKYHPEAREEINRRIDRIAAAGRDPVPKRVRFTTWTLRYSQMLWVRVDGLEEHWERARVDAEIVDDHTVRVTTENVSALTLSMPAGLCPLDNTRPPVVILNKRNLTAPAVESDRSWTAHFQKEGARWAVADASARASETEILRKRPGLQGPIDDAFLDSFLMVAPSKSPFHDATARWVNAELAHATNHWRRQFRGLARVKADHAVTEADIQNHHLILWGDPSSNELIARIQDQLPLQWNDRRIDLGAQSFSSRQHMPVLIYPNPLNPKRYVVLNSGFTFREYDYLNNARQVPKLPDFAVIDIAQPVTSRSPGGIAAAGFFDESWRVPAK
ncbi:MAG TPA: hypothetical protein VLD18_08070, partial [Verrucomicrobiae bacterium]|nr:hypothetical protein [Verrucomicrobiae bacterium]